MFTLITKLVNSLQRRLARLPKWRRT